jgi:hypothetical protein
MQAFKLVNGGFVDKVIVFDTLPERFTKNVRTRAADGFPRAWAKWLAEIGSLRTVFATETNVDMARNWTYKHTPIGKEPCFFVLEYTDINADKEMWRNICDYLKANCGPEVRLKEKIEDMALALAANSTQPLSVEYEDIPVIKLPSEVVVEPSKHELVGAGEQIIVQELAKKKGGRPKKVAVTGV